jgi:hypothetical protein
VRPGEDDDLIALQVDGLVILKGVEAARAERGDMIARAGEAVEAEILLILEDVAKLTKRTSRDGHFIPHPGDGGTRAKGRANHTV